MRIPLDLPPGLFSNDTSYGVEGRWGDGDNARFYGGRPQSIGGWERFTSSALTGVCRSILPWADNAAILNVGFGTHSNLQVWQGGALYDVTPFGPPTPLWANPLAVTNTSATVTVTHTAHGRTTGDAIKLFGAAAIGGITPTGGPLTITVTDANHYTFVWTSNATSTVTAGGGSAIVVTPQVTLPAGATDGTGSAGYGSGAYGDGPYGQTSPTADFYPRSWSLGAWGEQLLASPRGGGLFLWQNNTAQRAAVVDGAPTRMTSMLVAPLNGGYQAFALGTQQEADGVFNPMCIRHSSVRDLTVWSTLASGSTAREYILTGGGEIISGRMCGPYVLVWTGDALFLGAYVGALNQPWRFDRVGRNCGLIGPNAVVIVGQTAYWASPDAQFYAYSPGGSPTPIPCPIRQDFADNLALSQGDKIFASSNARFSEVRFDYPDSRDGYENSRYVALALVGVDAGAWHKGMMPRTAFVDAGPQPYPIGVTYDGVVYYHEKGNSADGGTLAWRIRTAAQELDINFRLNVRGVWPDFKDQVGPVTVTVYARETPEATPTSLSAPALASGDTKADLLISGRLFEVEFSGSSAPAYCRLGRPIFDVVQAGKI